AESQLGKMYYEIGYLPAAGEHLQVSKRLWTMLGNPLEAAQDTFVLVETLRLGERFIEATDSIFEIQPVVLRLGSEKLAGDWWFQYAVICAVMSSFSQCIDSLNKALDYYPQNCPEQRAACYALMIYATAKIERKVDEQHALEALQVLDPDLTTFTYAPSICTGLASVLKDEPLRAALLQKSSRHLKAAAQKITDESIREQFFARPDRHTLLNLSKSEYMG
ncbi:MAG TPA: hypothetical protein VJZ27_17475, partial [Aggregatilineales bacterium]|nr:hypothetical protein [Aggregatilineales bacterium]